MSWTDDFSSDYGYGQPPPEPDDPMPGQIAQPVDPSQVKPIEGLPTTPESGGWTPYETGGMAGTDPMPGQISAPAPAPAQAAAPSWMADAGAAAAPAAAAAPLPPPPMPQTWDPNYGWVEPGFTPDTTQFDYTNPSSYDPNVGPLPAQIEAANTPAPPPAAPEPAAPAAPDAPAPVSPSSGVGPGTANPFGGAGSTNPLVGQLQGMDPADERYAPLQDQLAREVKASLEGEGHKVEWNGSQLLVDGRPYDVGPAPQAAPTWQGSDAATFTPTPLGAPAPVADVPLTGQLDSWMSDYLQHPESLSPQIVAEMKAQNADQENAAALTEDTANKRFGFQAGYQDSPWLASLRAQSTMGHDTNLLNANRNLDITAAQTNAADRLKAGQLASGYQSQRVSQALQTFQATSGEANSRATLNNNLAAEAAKQGLAQSALEQQYVTSVMSDLRTKYGIDVTKQLQAGQLEHATNQQRQDLMLALLAMQQRMAEDQTQNDQFQANLGLNYDQLNAQVAAQ